ncbi:MAG: hypothetical protein WCK57_00725 [Verrucomicrobiae bacterium]
MKKPIRTHKPEPGIEWAWIEIKAADLATEKAGKHGFAVYCALCILIRDAKSDHKSNFTGSIPDIMKITGLKRNSVCGAIKLLRASELLTVVSGDMKGNSNIYTLHQIGLPDKLPRFAAQTTSVCQTNDLGLPDKHQAKGRKDSSPSEKESLSSEKGQKSASAGNPSAVAGVSDSAPQKPYTGVNEF